MKREDYIEELKKIKSSVYIFGAGHIAKIVYELARDNSVDVEGFLVSDIKQNKDKLFGINVCQADSKNIIKDKIVLVAVLQRGSDKIIPYLKELGFENFVNIPDDILDCDSWEYKRMRTPIIEVTAKIGCAVNCRYCPQKLLITKYYEKNKNRQGVMSFDDYRRYLDKCPNETIVDFSGFVEPFLIDDSIKMMEYTYKTGHEMTLFTTLRGLSVEDAKIVIQMPFKYVCLHTPDKDNYAQIPMTDEYFDVLKMFLEATKANGEPFVDVANCQSEPHPEIVKRTQGKLKIYCEMSDRAGNLNEDDPSLTHVKKKGAIYCSRAYKLNHNVLLPDGTLTLCCNDFGLDNIIGNLNSQSYDEIMRGEEMINIKRAMNYDINKNIICRKCMFAINMLEAN